jgi:hypothetical protein
LWALNRSYLVNFYHAARLLTTGYCFGVCVQLLPVPMTGFIGALLLNQNLWMQDGLISATPKAFCIRYF